jgi:hypothetical protein
VAFFIPLFWYYGERWVRKKRYLAGSVLAGYVLLFIPAFFFNLPQHKESTPRGLNVPYARVLSPALPYYERPDKYKIALAWLKAKGVSKSDFLFSNINNRWLNANLNLPQNHYLKSSEIYDQSKGFLRQSLDDICVSIQSRKPRFIIWDLGQHRQEFHLVLRDGKEKVDYSPEQFLLRLGDQYQKLTVLGEEILILERV